MVKRLLWVVGLCLAMANAGWAQTSDTPSASDPQGQQQLEGTTQTEKQPSGGAPSSDGEILQEEQDSEIRAGKLIGMSVKNVADEDLGTVDDIVFDRDGRVTGLVLSTGGFLGFGAKPVGISWSDVESAMDSDELILDLSMEQLAQAPEFKTKEERRQEKETEMMREQQQQSPQQQSPLTKQPGGTDQ